MRRDLPLVSLGVALAALIGCSSNDGDGEGPVCPRGTVLDDDGNCVRTELDTDNADTTDGDVGVDEDADATETTTDTAVDTTTDTGPLPDPPPCVAGATQCGDDGIPEDCVAEEWVDSEPCMSGEGCLAGECVPGAGCTPGDVNGCASDTERLVCNEAGNHFDAMACGEGEYCFDGVCGVQRCEPVTRACDTLGEWVMVCANDGSRWHQVERCDIAGGEACSQGECVSGCVEWAKEPSYIGCEYWSLDLPQQTDELTQDTAERAHHALVVANMGDRTSDVLVETDSGIPLIDEQVSVEPGEIGIIEFPRADIKFTSRSDRSFRVTSTQPVVAYQFNPLDYVEAASNDASLLLPSNTLGRDYWVMSWPSGAKPLPEFADTAQTGGFTVLATAEGTTTVDIAFSANVIDGEDPDLQGIVEGTIRTYSLQQGELLNFEGLSTISPVYISDLSGSRVTADRPIAVFGWHEQAVIGDGCCAEHMEQQLFPISTWGRHYMAVHSPQRGSEPDVWRIIAAEDDTLIHTRPPVGEFDGVVLNAGEFLEAEVHGAFEIEATRPIMVSQFLYSQENAGGIGDPAFVLAVPVEQYLSSYTVLSPDNFNESHISVIRPAGVAITLDGAMIPDSAFTSFGSGTYEVGYQEVNPGVHRLASAEDAPFATMTFGYSNAVSYGVPGGLSLNPRELRVERE